MISRETVFEVIKQCASEKGAKIPDGLEADFEARLPEFDSLKTFNQVRVQLCRRIKKLLEEDGVLAEKYAEIYGQISQSVRLELVSLLGFQDYAVQPVYDGKSSRQLLKEFLQTLEEGQSWNMLKLSEWEINGDNVGDKLRTRISAAAGPWNTELAGLILGEEATELLKRNPLEKLEWRIRTIYDARRYLRTYLSTLPEGASWSYATLYEWVPPDGIDGVSVIMQIKEKTGNRGFTEDAVRAVLGAEANDLLKRNPFTKRIIRLDSRQKAKQALLDFMGSLDEGVSWSISAELYQWTSEGGIRGNDLYDWICRNLGGFSETEIREVLGEDADEALRRNPFTKTSKSNTDLTAASRNLTDFLLGMPAGQVWSITDLQAHGQIGDGAQGKALYSWVCHNLGACNLATVKQMLGERAEELLTRNPFEVRHINRVVDVEAASKYLKKFLELWPAEISWSSNDLQQFGEIDDGVYGYSVYRWIDRHYESGFGEAALREVLNGDADRLLLRSPFERKCADKILTLEDFKRFFRFFLDCLPEEEYWTPSTLLQFKPSNSEMPKGVALYGWTQRNITYDGTIDWLRVLVELTPLEYLKKHPFRHKHIGVIDAKDRSESLAKPFMTRRGEIPLDRTITAAEIHGFIPDPEKLLMAKEGVERMMQRREFMSGIYKYLEIHEWILMNRFYQGEDIGEDKLFYLMGRVREIFLEHKPELVDDLD